MSRDRTMVTIETESDRGQAYVLEGVIGVLVITLALVLGMSAVDIAPWAGSEEQTLEETEQQAEDVLEIAHGQGMLNQVAACVAGQEVSDQALVVREENQPTLLRPNETGLEFEELIEDSFSDTSRLAVQLEYPDSGGPGTDIQSLTRRNPPETASRSASKRVTLSDTESILQGAQCTDSGDDLDVADAGTNFYFEDQQDSTDFFGVVTIRVIVW
jgi:hypothetical protein